MNPTGRNNPTVAIVRKIIPIKIYTFFSDL